MNLTKKERSTLWVQLLVAIGTIIIGILFIYRDQLVWRIVFWAMLIILVVSALLSFFSAINNRNIFEALIGLGALIMALLVYINEDLHVEIIALIFGVWALFNAVVHGLEFFVHMIDNTKGKLSSAFATLLSLGMGLLLILSGVQSRFLVNLQVGGYIIIYGFVQGLSSIRVLFGNKIRLSFSPPVFFAALIPNFLVRRISKIQVENPEAFREDIAETTGDYMSVYLYAKNEGFNRMGHLDIGYNKTIYSYGAHDNFNRAKSMAYGAGVMIIGSEKEFVQYAVDTGTTVFRFLVKITEEQSERIEARIEKILKDSYYYDYPYQDDPEGENYLSRLRNENLHLDFYKFKKGKFKTYNVFSTNCVILADQIVEATGMRLFKMSGVATPGAYYEYMDSQINKPGSIVMSKEIYRGKK